MNITNSLASIILTSHVRMVKLEARKYNIKLKMMRNTRINGRELPSKWWWWRHIKIFTKNKKIQSDMYYTLNINNDTITVSIDDNYSKKTCSVDINNKNFIEKLNQFIFDQCLTIAATEIFESITSKPNR